MFGLKKAIQEAKEAERDYLDFVETIKDKDSKREHMKWYYKIKMAQLGVDYDCR